jgi:hypothetical protein
MIEVINKIVRTSRQMLNEIGREPTPEELANKLRMPLEKVRKTLKIAKEPLSRRCSESTARLQEPDALERACGLGVLRECSLREYDPGYVPIANRSAESFDIYSRSTLRSNFEIGSRADSSRFHA